MMDELMDTVKTLTTAMRNVDSRIDIISERVNLVILRQKKLEDEMQNMVDAWNQIDRKVTGIDASNERVKSIEKILWRMENDPSNVTDDVKEYVQDAIHEVENDMESEFEIVKDSIERMMEKVKTIGNTVRGIEKSLPL